MGLSHRNRTASGGRASLITTDRLRGQRGASLVIALAMLLILAVVLAAVITYANTSLRTSNAYRKQRVNRYAGDAAIETAINYVRGQALMGRDPLYDNTDPPCVQNVTVGTGKDARTIAVTCEADPGSNSGVPNETGLVPAQAILALGQRHNELGPWNQTQCDTFWGIGQDAQREQSILFDQGEVRGYFEEGSLIPCAERNRTLGTFTVRGDVVAAGQVAGEGTVSMLPHLNSSGVSVPSLMKAEYGCSIAVNPSGCVSGGALPDGAWADPGNGGTTTAWQNVPINWTTRTTAYKWNGTSLVASPSCGARDTIIFLPGAYFDANVINRYTANSACKESTFWFAPEAGADGILLTDDDKTGAYYFGFTNGNTDWQCSDLSNLPHRLCIGGGSADSSPRVVGGTPIDWNPLGVPGSGPTPRTVTMDTAQTIDSGLSQTWSNGGNARKIDGSYATYNATFCLFGICLSSDRSIRLRDFAPQVAQGPDSNLNSINISVAHREIGSFDGRQPEVQIRTVSEESGTRTCPNTYKLPINSTGALRTDRLTLNGDANAASAAIAQCLDSADRINGLQLTFYFYGNSFNSGHPQILLDGAKVEFQSTPGATFPLPGSSGGPAAQIDCDKTKAGTQLIFGGDSHAYVPDGSLEVCAGPYPTSPGSHQQIAVYGVPAVPPLLGTGTPTAAAYESASNVSISNPTRARDIAEVPSRLDANISFRSTNDCSGFCAWTRQYSARTTMNMATYSPPSGLQLNSLTARVTYNSKNTRALEFIETNDRTACRAWVITKLVLTFGFAEGTNCANSTLQIGSCSYDAPMTDTMRSWDVNVTGCLNQSQIASGAQMQWVSRADHLRFCAFWVCSDFGSKSTTHDLDGMELLVGLSQTNGSTTPVPQSGCIVDYPNYWEGVGRDDCAIIKADSLRPTNGILPDWILAEGADWIGRLSLQGTVYAPSAAFEVDELDSAYALAGRGLVVRHLRVKGFRNRPGYTAPVIDTQLDTTPAAREATFYACIRGTGRSGVTTRCDKSAGDKILTRARVRFKYEPTTPTSWTPELIWWTDQR